MGEEWIIRVAGREYGPVDTDVLREWKAEGRLIPENEVRKAGDEHWIQAGMLEEVFGGEEPAPLRTSEPAALRSWQQILAETFRIYRTGLGPFMLFGLLSAAPMFVVQWTMPKITIPDLSAGGASAVPWPTLQPISVAMLVLFLALWPLSTAGFQFVADDILSGRRRSFVNQFKAALARWRQVFAGALLVYGSYFFWLFVPLVVLIGLVEGGQISVLGFLLFLLIATFMIYMSARLFINFLFWQQTCALRPDGALAALRESKDLARSVQDGPRVERPLYRGAILASVWLLLLLILTVGVQLPFMLARFVGVANPQEAVALARTLAESESPDLLMIMADLASAALNLFMQPLLAAAFVVLYYDARARAGKTEDDEISSD